MQELLSAGKEFACSLHPLLDDFFVWKKQLSKVANIVFSLPFDDKVWSLAIRENLILVIVLSFVCIRPWKIQGTQLVIKYEWNIQEVWEKEERLGRNYLHKLLVSARTLEKFPEMWCGRCYCLAENESFP